MSLQRVSKSPFLMSRVVNPILCRGVRRVEITENEEKKETVIEGVKIPSDRIAKLIKSEFLDSIQTKNTGKCPSGSNCHPLCKLPFVHEIKHTDVLILNQFVQEDGKIIPREHTGLCSRQHYRMNKLIRMAQKAGLFPNKDIYRQEKEEKPWARFNTYWDEKTIDIQWNEKERLAKIKSFRK